jgi:hypothetical protein
MIKNLGGVFGRNPTFNNVEVEGDLTVEGSIIGPVVVDAGTLTGATLAANVVNSSLTSVGTLSALTVTATIAGSINGNAATATTATTAATVTTAAQPAITSVGTLTGQHQRSHHRDKHDCIDLIDHGCSHRCGWRRHCKGLVHQRDDHWDTRRRIDSGWSECAALEYG